MTSQPQSIVHGRLTRAEELRKQEEEHKGIVLYINDFCPKGCSFCFIPGQIKLMDREMPLENIRRLIDDLGFKHFQVQGGEPTLHKQFPEILQLFKDRGVTCNILSNILYNSKIKRVIRQAIDDEVITGFAPNCSELDSPEKRFKRWKDNYLDIYEGLEKKWGTGAGANMISLMWTIPKGFREGIDPFTKEKYKLDCLEYIDWLETEIKGKFHILRIGLDLCGTYIINNRKIGKILDDLDAMGQQRSFQFYMDCQCPPCINEPDEPRPWHSNQIGEAGCPADQGGGKYIEIKPDMSVVHCFQSQGEIGMPYVIKNIFEFKFGAGPKLPQLQKEHRWRYIETNRKIDMPKACQECPHFPYKCNGICMGCTVQEHERTKDEKGQTRDLAGDFDDNKDLTKWHDHNTMDWKNEEGKTKTKKILPLGR